MTDETAYAGIRVLDFTQGIAGPHGAMLLAQHGADVIKIEPRDGDWGRTLGRIIGDNCAHSVAFNRGKRSIAVDLKNPDAQAVMKKQAAVCDVIVEAFRPGVMKKFGLSYEDVKAVNPDVIYLSVTGFGQEGPYKDLPVTDAVIQAHSGLMTVNKDSQGLPNRLNMLPIDVVTGVYAFQGLAAALMRKFRYGGGCYIDNSLMQSAAAFQAAKLKEYYFENGPAPVLYSPVGTVPTADGHINISAMREKHYVMMCDVLGRPELATDPRFDNRDKRVARDDELMPIIREEFAKKTTAHWAKALTEAGVMNAEIQDHGAFMADGHTKAVDAVAYVDHGDMGTVPMPQIPGLPPIDAAGPLAYAPHIGEHTEKILGEWGYDVAAIAGFIASGAFSSGETEA